jgi:predicted flap endonuclease-1-like 5' DNA nuclease
MVGAVLLAFLAVSLVVGGLALLVWWLSRLWQHHEEAAEVPVIEIKAEPPAEPLDLPEAEVEVEEHVEAALPTEEPEPPEAEVETGTPTEEVAAAEAEVELQAEEPEAEEAEAEVTADDLTRIEGIGPKISQVLQASGISTYAELARKSPGDLRQILEDSDPRLGRITKPDTWSEQAGYAAAGDWDGLDELKARLKGGR